MNKEDKDFIKTEIDHLAAVTAKGFEQVDRRFEQVDKHFEAIETRLDRMENLLLQDHTNSIERLEDKMHLIETAAGR